MCAVFKDYEGVAWAMTDAEGFAAQMAMCSKYGAEYMPSPNDMKLGISFNVKSDAVVVNGARHPPVGDTTGWYIWGGESMSEEENFFKPLHVGHLSEWRPELLKYLGLSPGWRFLIAPGHEDVWFDPEVLNIEHD